MHCLAAFLAACLLKHRAGSHNPCATPLAAATSAPPRCSVCVDRARSVAGRGAHRHLLPPADEGAGRCRLGGGGGGRPARLGLLPSRLSFPIVRCHITLHCPPTSPPPHPQLVDYNLMAWATALFAPYMADFKRHAKKD